jgi:hypothetical protein
LSLFQSSENHRLDNAIDVLLSELAEDCGSSSGLADQRLQVSNSFGTEAFTGKRDLDALLPCFTCDHLLPPCVLWGTLACGSRSAASGGSSPQESEGEVFPGGDADDSVAGRKIYLFVE